MQRWLIVGLLFVASCPLWGQTRLEYRVEPIVDLYMHARWLAQQDREDVPARLCPAVDICRDLGGEFGRNILAWGELDGLVSGCRSGVDLVAAFEQVPESITLRGGREVRLRERAQTLARAIADIEPWWRDRRWRERRRLIELGRQSLDQTLTPVEDACFAWMIDRLGIREPEGRVPVYLVVDAPWPGAMTFLDRAGRGVCFVSVASADDTALAEIVLHEASHALDVDSEDGVFRALRDGLIRAGVDRRSPAIRNVPHAIMFIQAGATIRRFVDPEHVDYGERDGLYDRIPEARLEREIWHGYLAGEMSRDEAVERIIDEVVARRAHGTSDPP